MIRIPAGDYLYGQKTERNYLADFDIMKYPVTVAQYRKFCIATKREMPLLTPSWGWQDTHPIVNVSWEDAAAFAVWAGLALPTQEEWEKAARGTDGRKYPWGNQWDATKCCNSVSASAGQTASVGSYPTGASPYGVQDMEGNVWEWCDSWYEDNSTRVLRGGSWNNNDPDYYRAAFRRGGFPAYWGGNSFTGFRCVLRSPGQ